MNGGGPAASVAGPVLRAGPNPPRPQPGVNVDFDDDNDVETGDFAIFAQNFTGSM